jgi:molecular chaperone HtpG
MVADKVEIFTKTNNNEGIYRSSTGDADYEIKTQKKTERGTRIILHLNNESHEYLEDYRIRSLIRKYADYIPVAILMEKTDEEKKTTEWEQINSMTAIRQKNKKDVTEEEYTKHFQSLAFSQDKPLDIIHLNVEGNINYKAILYIPRSTNPFVDLNDPNKEYGPSLYVQNVMIMDHCKDLLPAWMRHIVGIVETPDLPLNVSREILQQSSIMSKIQTSLIKEVVKSLVYIKKENNSDYITYYNNF